MVLHDLYEPCVDLLDYVFYTGEFGVEWNPPSKSITGAKDKRSFRRCRPILRSAVLIKTYGDAL